MEAFIEFSSFEIDYYVITDAHTTDRGRQVDHNTVNLQYMVCFVFCLLSLSITVS